MNKATKGLELIRRIAQSYLQMNPDPIPKLLILRDILHRNPADKELCEVEKQSLQSKWIKQLESEQNPNGGWSRFHSMNSKVRYKIPTTEYAVFKAHYLGLDQDDALLARAQSYCEGLLNGTISWPEDEGKEPNDRWPAGEEMFVSATLAMIDPQNPLVQSVADKWCHIADAAFASGTYDPEAEWRAHCRLTGATTMRNSYLVISNRYALTLLGCAQPRIRTDTASALLDWLWRNPQGIGYLGTAFQKPVTSLHPRAFGGWFTSHWILSHFETWRVKIKPSIDLLWSMQTPEGFWDIGAKASQHNFHLSESWRKAKNRLIDLSIRVLLLMERYYAEGE